MFSKEELLVIEDALKIADNEYMRLLTRRIEIIKIGWWLIIESKKVFG